VLRLRPVPLSSLLRKYDRVKKAGLAEMEWTKERQELNEFRSLL